MSIVTVISHGARRHVVTVVGLRGPQLQPQCGEVGALMAANKLSEFATDPTVQEEAQQHLGLGIADPLAYYILAKA